MTTQQRRQPTGRAMASWLPLPESNMGCTSVLLPCLLAVWTKVCHHHIIQCWSLCLFYRFISGSRAILSVLCAKLNVSKPVKVLLSAVEGSNGHFLGSGTALDLCKAWISLNCTMLKYCLPITFLLPIAMQHVAAGLDLAQATRNFSDFLSGVSYSAIPQAFLELPDASPNSKQLRSLAPRHVQQVCNWLTAPAGRSFMSNSKKAQRLDQKTCAGTALAAAVIVAGRQAEQWETSTACLGVRHHAMS